MALKPIISILFAGFIFLSCSNLKKSTEKTILIGSETKPCTAGVMETQCMQVKWAKDQKDWQFFYGNIEGFTYEKGYDYELIVNEEKVANPPADGSSLKYKLIKEVSKTKVIPKIDAQPFTSTHIFKAKLKDTKFHTCMGRTSACPKDCGSSGDMANFDVVEYKTHLVNGEAGRDKLTTYTVQLGDYYKKDFNKDYVKSIRTLKPNDVVTVHTDYIYDTSKSSVGTVEEIRSIAK